MAPQTKNQRELFGRWQDRLKIVRHELHEGFLDQYFWTEIRDELQERHPTADASWFVSYTRMYVGSQMLRVRRLVDDDRKANSLLRVVRSIAKNRDTFTRTHYVDRWASHQLIGGREVGEAEWDRKFADANDAELISQEMLDDDIDRLTSELDHITAWATKTIAHLDPTRPQRVPRYNEIRDALDLLVEVTARYQLYLDGSVTPDWTPEVQGDWRAPFRPALFAAGRAQGA